MLSKHAVISLLVVCPVKNIIRTSSESVTVLVRKMDPKTQVLIKERIPPSGFLEHNFGSCASFNVRKVNS